MKYILFAGENIGWYQRLLLKCAKKIINNPPAKANAAKTGSVTQAHGKRGTVTCRTNNLAQGENFLPNPPGGSKNVILCFLENMRYST